MDQFTIVEFYDGLQLIPTIWCDKEKLSSIWPSHMKTKFRINKAILGKEMPRERSDWEELPIKKLLGKASKRFSHINYYLGCVQGTCQYYCVIPSLSFITRRTRME